MAKHYIITDETGIILRGFSDDFEQPDALKAKAEDAGARVKELEKYKDKFPKKTADAIEKHNKKEVAKWQLK